MSLPSQAVDRLFERLTATYGRQFTNLYEGVDIRAVKASWGHELSGFANRLQCIAWALENLPARAPNAIEFRNLCRQAKVDDEPQLPAPKADPERVKAELAKLGQMRAAQTARASVDRSWAHRIIARHDSGAPVASLTLRMARDVVRGVCE